MTSRTRKYRFVKGHAMFKLGFARDTGGWKYMVDGDSDPFWYWRNCLELQVSLGFLTIYFRKAYYLIEQEPGELHHSKFHP